MKTRVYVELNIELDVPLTMAEMKKVIGHSKSMLPMRIRKKYLRAIRARISGISILAIRADEPNDDHLIGAQVTHVGRNGTNELPYVE